jgi:hypothetical protein
VAICALREAFYAVSVKRHSQITFATFGRWVMKGRGELGPLEEPTNVGEQKIADLDSL